MSDEQLYPYDRLIASYEARISSLERELEEATKRADHWQHQFHVMGETANKAEYERDEARAERDAVHDLERRTFADWQDVKAQLDQARALLREWDRAYNFALEQADGTDWPVLSKTRAFLSQEKQ